MKPFYDHKYFYDRGCILDREPFYDRGFSKKPFIIMIHEREHFLFFYRGTKSTGRIILSMYYNLWLIHTVQNTTPEITASGHW
jgi:hypothetical protein